MTPSARPRLVAVVALAAALAALASGCTATSVNGPSPTPEATAGDASGPEYLWTLSAADGSVIGTDDAHLYLELDGVDDVVTRFTDRPDRLASAVGLQDFLSRWDGRFDTTPPNAVVSYEPDGSSTPEQIVVTLSRPRWDDQAKSLVFAAERIRKQADDLSDTEHPVGVPAIDNPQSTGPVAVFIDGADGTGAVGPVGSYSGATSQDAKELVDLFLAQRDADLQAQITSYTNEIRQNNLRIGELTAAENDVVGALSSGAELSAQTRSVLASLGFAASRPVTEELRQDIAQAIDLEEEHLQLNATALQNVVDKSMISYPVRDQADDLINRFRTDVP